MEFKHNWESSINNEHLNDIAKSLKLDVVTEISGIRGVVSEYLSQGRMPPGLVSFFRFSDEESKREWALPVVRLTRGDIPTESVAFVGELTAVKWLANVLHTSREIWAAPLPGSEFDDGTLLVFGSSWKAGFMQFYRWHLEDDTFMWSNNAGDEGPPQLLTQVYHSVYLFRESKETPFDLNTVVQWISTMGWDIQWSKKTTQQDVAEVARQPRWTL